MAPQGADGRVASRATAGAVVPDLRLVNQDGTPVTLRDPAGRVLIVTFLYTRCPMPDMCPLMVRHLEAVRRRANDAGLGSRLALLGVTLDPEFDTPAVLRTYGESVLKESESIRPVDARDGHRCPGRGGCAVLRRWIPR